MAVSSTWVRRVENIEQSLRLYRETEMTIKEISQRLETTQHNIQAVLRRNMCSTERKKLQALRYAKAKRGAKNPMHNRTGEQHHNWKGDCFDGRGYLTRVHNGKRQFVHRIVMAQALGVEEIPSSLIVHHVDGDPTNNDLDNLALMTASAHMVLHSEAERDARIATSGQGPLDRKRALSWEAQRRRRQLKDANM